MLLLKSVLLATTKCIYYQTLTCIPARCGKTASANGLLVLPWLLSKVFSLANTDTGSLGARTVQTSPVMAISANFQDMRSMGKRKGTIRKILHRLTPRTIVAFPKAPPCLPAS